MFLVENSRFNLLPQASWSGSMKIILESPRKWILKLSTIYSMLIIRFHDVVCICLDRASSFVISLSICVVIRLLSDLFVILWVSI